MKFTFSLMHPHRLGYTLLRTYSEGNIDKKRVYHSDQSARAKNLQTRLHRSPVLIVTDNVITKVYTNRERQTLYLQKDATLLWQWGIRHEMKLT